MKKWIALALALTMAFSMTACGMSRMLTQEEIDNIAHGTVENGVYENAHFAIGCAPGEGWDVQTQEEIWQANAWDGQEEIAVQMMDSLAKPGYFYEMMAETADHTETVGVCVENVSIIEDPDSTAEDYVRSAVVTAREAFDAIGVEGAVIEQIEATVAGQQCLGYYAHFKNGDAMLHQKVVYLHHGIYAAVITVSCKGENITDQLLEMFYEV